MIGNGYGVPVLQIYTSDPSIVGATPSGFVVTDHNRQPLNISYDTIESSNRMANGTLRRYITANKKKINTSWDMVPAAGGKNFTADGNLGAAWLKSFYEENVYNPVWIRLIYAEEGWRFANTNSITTPSAANNQTYNYSTANTAIPNSFVISNKSFGSISNGVGTASISTATPHNLSAGTEIYITGVDQLFNGTWIVSSSVSSSVVTFTFGSNNNASANFRINSYIQSGTSASFNVDDTSFIQNGASIVIANSKNNIGNSINGNWVITSTPTSKTQFTASSTTSQTARGQYGDVTIRSSSSYFGSVSSISPAIVGPAIGSDVLKVFMTNFSYDIQKRFALTDYVNMSIEFTEI